MDSSEPGILDELLSGFDALASTLYQPGHGARSLCSPAWYTPVGRFHAGDSIHSRLVFPGRTHADPVH